LIWKRFEVLVAIHFNFVNCPVCIYPASDDGDGDGIVIESPLDEEGIPISTNHPSEED